MAAPIYYTADMARALPDDGNRYEVVHGELLVTPAPRPWHEVLVVRLTTALGVYLRSEPVGQVFGSRADVSWGRHVLVEPDVFVVPVEEARTLDWSRMRSLLLVAEVLSPSSQRADRFTKRRLYQERGVREYWVVDGDARVVEVWGPEAELPAIERDRLTWQPPGASEPFTLSLEDLFRPI
ncbi:MAG: Uma2 family endonuclease [Gemmatimonadales bacterium]